MVMDPAEQALLNALYASPEDWSIRLLIAEKFQQRGAEGEAFELISQAPTAPNNPEELEKAANLGGQGALPQARAYVASNPADGYGHQLLGHLLQNAGDEESAHKHFTAAAALGSISSIADAPASPDSSSTPPQGTPHDFALPQVVQPDSPSEYYQPEASYYDSTYSTDDPCRPKKKTGNKVTAILIAVGVHLIIGLIAALLVILPPMKDDPEIVAAVIGPPAAKQEMQKKNVVKQVKKSTSAAAAAAPVAQLMRASATAKFSLPKVTKTSTGPLGMGEGNLGSGGFGGTGSGLGSGASFFGGTSTGQRFLFVLDHSKSMKKHQVELRNKELEKALKGLRGVQYQVLIFAGAAYYAQQGWSIKGLELVTDPEGKTYRFIRKSTTNFEFSGSDSSLPKAEWLDANSSNARKTMSFLRKTPLFVGTDWEMALRVGHYMDPPPDVIFFMADGTGGNDPGPILRINRRQGRPVINMIAMQTSNGAKQFAEVAKETRGGFTIVDKKGDPINGFEYLTDPGKFKGRL